MHGGKSALIRESRFLVSAVHAAAAAAPNEVALVHEIEKALQLCSRALNIPYRSFTLDLRVGADAGTTRFADVVHGGLVIEYEAPRSFAGREGARVEHARRQVEEYVELLSAEEGRPIADYVLVAWDGGHISFGSNSSGSFRWSRLRPFGEESATRLLRVLATSGVPLVSPALISEVVGPSSEIGAELIPKLFRAIQAAESEEDSSKTKLLFREWRRLFGQVVGVQSDSLKALLQAQGAAHGQPYKQAPAAYLFALNSYIALVAKVVAALSLPGIQEDIADESLDIHDRITALESGHLFENAGISNMLSGDFFGWYAEDRHWKEFKAPIGSLVSRLDQISFDVAKKTPESTRDLFKGMYETFVPRALRHALGEFYTPDWLAGHALDAVQWKPADDLLDPTCGTGTFLLEALKRRLSVSRRESATKLLEGLYGLDLNPLAVLAARASLVVFLSKRLDSRHPIRIPVFLADAINPATKSGAYYQDLIPTEQGPLQFKLPASLVEAPYFPQFMERCRSLIESDAASKDILRTLLKEFRLKPLADDLRALEETLVTLGRMHRLRWDGLWATLLGERFAAGAIPRVSHIVGNPPWVKWSHLPPDYAELIKPRCLQLGVFSQDRWVGGIESDISTVITYEVVDKWLADKGRLAFFITGTVFFNESSQGFRRFQLGDGAVPMAVERVEDFSAVKPFDGVTNFPTLLILRKGGLTRYPIPYVLWSFVRPSSKLARRKIKRTRLWARPVPGTDAGPWLRGSAEQQEVWAKIFGPALPAYKARKGITTDLNGVFFVRVLNRSGAFADIENDPNLGRKSLSKVRRSVEERHLYPLLRGRGVTPFSALPDPEFCALLPQTTMHGDADLAHHSPLTHRYLSRFKRLLELRGSYRRFQAKQVYWSVWSTGPYTFSEWKVLWREMGGGRFAAAYTGPVASHGLSSRPVVPDHKLYFVPTTSEDESAYITGVLNAPTVAEAVSAYASQLSLGTSVVEYLELPAFDAKNRLHRDIAKITKSLVAAPSGTAGPMRQLDVLARRLFDL